MFTINEAILIGGILWGLFVLMFFISFFMVPNFKLKLPFFLKKISGKKFGILTLKIIGVITFFYFAGGTEYDQSRVISSLLFFSGIMVLVLMGLLTNLNEKFTVEELSQKDIRKAKLKKIKRKSLIYRIKNIF